MVMGREGDVKTVDVTMIRDHHPKQVHCVCVFWWLRLVKKDDTRPSVSSCDHELDLFHYWKRISHYM